MSARGETKRQAAGETRAGVITGAMEDFLKAVYQLEPGGEGGQECPPHSAPAVLRGRKVSM